VGRYSPISRPHRTDAELLAAHVDGDRYAFEELFFRHRPALARLATVTSRSAEDADDALQDAMLSAHRNAARFRHDSAVSSWLYRIVVNACLDRLRRNKTHPTTALEDDAAHIGDPTPRVDTAIVVERALMRLPVEQRAAVVAVDMQGYSVAETASMLGVPEGTVKSRCSRGRAKLAAELRIGDDADAPSTAAGGSRVVRHSPTPRTGEWLGSKRHGTGGSAYGQRCVRGRRARRRAKRS
jgi:RNA polymerase sigma-70 factor (ECF subfamily)